MEPSPDCQLTPVGTVKKLFLITIFFTLALALCFFVYSVQLDYITTPEYHINKMDTNTITLPFVSFVQTGFQFFVFGALALMFAHNFVISAFYFKTRQSTFSNILKMVFNFSGCLRLCLLFGSAMISFDVTTPTCKGVFIPYNLSQFTFLSSLALFILWRLRQIESKPYDLAIGGFLFFVRVAAHLTQVVITKPVAEEFPSTPGLFYCSMHIEKSVEKGLFYTYNGTDFAIDLYVTLRLVHILSKANRNAKHVTTNMRRPHKRSLFTAVMYWNFLRLFAASLHYAVILSGVIKTQVNAFRFWPYNFFALMLLSYTVTADAEIVRTIEGRPANSNKGSGYSSSNDTAKTSKTYTGSQSPRAPYYKGQVVSFKDDDDYLQSQSVQLSSARQQPVYEDVSGQKVGVSMKRASFFEWASAVVGVRRNDLDEQYEQYDDTRNDRDIEKAEINDAVEVILDERPTSEEQVAEESEANAENFDPDHGLSDNQRRSSTFSGDTVTNGTTENNPVVHAL